MGTGVEKHETLSLTGTQKLAALLVILGADSASRVLQRLDEPEIEAVSAEVAKLQVVGDHLQRQILKEFGEIVAQNAMAVRGGSEYAQNLLQKSIGVPKATAILNKVAPARPSTPAIEKLCQLEPGQIAGALKHERAQAAALVVSCLGSKKAAQVLSLFVPEFRDQIIERIATLGPTPSATIDRVIEIILHRAGPQKKQVLAQPGGLKAAATLLNGMDKRLSQSVLESLQERNPGLEEAIRQKMFTFEDLAHLDGASLQRVMREVDLRDLALALKYSGESLQNILLGCISKRAAETVREEIGYLGAVRMREVEAAQLRVVAVVRMLEAEGEIDLGGQEEPVQEKAA